MRVACDQSGVLRSIFVHRHDDPLDRRHQLEILAAAPDRHQLLALPYPAVQADNVNMLNRSEQVRSEAVDADPRVLTAFLQYPGVPGMKAVVLGNREAVLALHASRRRSGPSRRLRDHFLARLEIEVVDRHDQQEHQQHKQDGHNHLRAGSLRTPHAPCRNRLRLC